MPDRYQSPTYHRHSYAASSFHTPSSLVIVRYITLRALGKWPASVTCFFSKDVRRYMHLGAFRVLARIDGSHNSLLVSPLHNITQISITSFIDAGQDIALMAARLIIRCQNCMQPIDQKVHNWTCCSRLSLPFHDLQAAALRLILGDIAHYIAFTIILCASQDCQHPPDLESTPVGSLSAAGNLLSRR